MYPLMIIHSLTHSLTYSLTHISDDTITYLCMSLCLLVSVYIRMCMHMRSTTLDLGPGGSLDGEFSVTLMTWQPVLILAGSKNMRWSKMTWDTVDGEGEKRGGGG